MPVATAAAMKGLTPEQVRSTGSQIILNNAYHLLLRPGGPRLAEMGGSHRFMRWDGPILTDSGGYQAYSMSDTARLDDDGVTFQSFVDGSRVHLGPESSMLVQNQIGADIIMAFDDCAPAALPEAGGDERRLARTRHIVDHAQRMCARDPWRPSAASTCLDLPLVAWRWAKEQTPSARWWSSPRRSSQPASPAT